MLGSHYLGRWKVKVTSIIKEPVNVNGLVALLALEDGARLLLTGQRGGVHCWGKRVLVSVKSTTSRGLKASLLPGPSPAPHQCLKPPPCLKNNPQSWGCSGWSQARTNLPVPGAALLPVPFSGCCAASNVGLTEEGEEQGQHSSASLSPPRSDVLPGLWPLSGDMVLAGTSHSSMSPCIPGWLKPLTMCLQHPGNIQPFLHPH